MDTDDPSDSKSLHEKFPVAGPTNSLPAYPRKRGGKPTLPPKPSIILPSNPALQGVLRSLENQVTTAAPPTVKKPELPPKPNGLSNAQNMRLSKVFRQTLHITNSTRTEGDGMCTNSPQVYRRSLPTFQEPPSNTDQPLTQEVYEDVESAWRPSPTTNDLKNAGGKHLPAAHGPNPVKMTSTPIPDALKAKKKENRQKGPRLKILPSMASLGPPPPKPLRFPNVDLSAFFTLQQNGVRNKHEESSGVEYELPAPSTTSNEDELYDEAFSPKDSSEGDSNAYELDAAEYDVPEAVVCYEEILKLQQSSWSSNVYDTEDADPASGPETAERCTYEAARTTGSMSPGSERPTRCHPCAPELHSEWILEVSLDHSHRSTMSSHPSIKSSVSEGYYSADLDTSNESFRKEHTSKEATMGKSGQRLRKRFKISGQEEVLYTSRITEDFKTERYSLHVKRGDTVEVIRITDCPAGKLLARDVHGNYGLIPVAGVRVVDDISSQLSDQELYADVDVRQKDSGSNTNALKDPDSYSAKSDDHYDDISNTSRTANSSGGKVLGQLFKKVKSRNDDVRYMSVLPDTSSTGRGALQKSAEYKTCAVSDQEREKAETFLGWKSIFHRSKEQKGSERKLFSSASELKKLSKEEKIFREKFKYTGDIKVVNIATINDLSPLSSKHKLELVVKPGETVEVIDVTSEDQIICRNVAGKYGYVQIKYLNF